MSRYAAQNKTVSRVARERLSEPARIAAAGYDGLYHPSVPCGCFVADLRPCGQVRTGCRMGLARDGDNGYGIYRGAVSSAKMRPLFITSGGGA